MRRLVALLAALAAGATNTTNTTPPVRIVGDAAVLYSADCVGAALDSGECIYAVGPNASHTLAFNGTGKVSAIAVDARRRRVYWTDRGNNQLWTSAVGAGRGLADARAVQGYMGEPRDIAVRRSTGAVYWADKSAGAVYVSLDRGSTRDTLIGGLDQPMGLAVDDATSTLYVAEYGGGNITMFDLGADAAANVTAGRAAAAFATNLSAPRALRVHERHLYWIEAGPRDDARDARDAPVGRRATATESVTPAFPPRSSLPLRRSRRRRRATTTSSRARASCTARRSRASRGRPRPTPRRRTTTTAPAAEPTAAAAARARRRRRSASPRG